MELLSIVVPCFNEQDSIPLFYEEIMKVAKQMDQKIQFEVIFSDDGSTDDTLNIVKKLSDQDSRIKFVSLSRNFGKESAMYAGFEKAVGDFVAIMDVDLQDPPALLEKMYDTLKKENVDCVATRRVNRKGEPPIRSFFARCFYSLINKISKVEIVDGARDYRVMTRQMLNSILSLKEYNRFSKGIFSWVGYNTKWLEYENTERVAGQTKWSFFKLFMYSLDGIIAFSTAPLAIASVMGLIFCFLGMALTGVVVFKTLFFGERVAGYPSLICAIMFIGGLQLFCIGILGEYLSKAYLETKNRPIYIIKDQTKEIK